MDKSIVDKLAVQERREYMRQWRSDNKERVKKHQQDYWRRKAAAKIANTERVTIP